MKRALPICLCILAAAFPAAARADIATLGAAKDNTVYQNNDWTSNGIGQTMYAGDTSTYGNRRSLIAFDITSAIPAGSTINSVSLRLHMSRTRVGSRQFDLHRLLADWGEFASDAGNPGGNGGQAEPGDATWVYRNYPTVQWITPGGDYSPIISGSTTVGNTLTNYVWTANAAGIADVQYWLNNPSQNFGWLLKGPENVGRSAKEFGTRENSNLDYQPLLTIDYTVPEPASAALLAVGALAIRRKRSAASFQSTPSRGS